MAHITSFVETVTRSVDVSYIWLYIREFAARQASNAGAYMMMWPNIATGHVGDFCDAQLIASVQFSKMSGNHLLKLELGILALAVHGGRLLSNCDVAS